MVCEMSSIPTLWSEMHVQILAMMPTPSLPTAVMIALFIL